MNPFFTIIIPTFNAERTVNKLLLSIQNQDFYDYEVLIMDGGSTDGTLKFVRELNDERFRIYTEPDLGIYDAMNKGIEKSKGRWFYFIGADDTLYGFSVLQTIYSIAQTKDAGILYGNVFLQGKTSWADKGHYGNMFNLANILHKNICHQSMFYHRSTFEQIGNYNTLYPICADWDLNLRAFAKVKFSYIDVCIAYFGEGGVSSRKADVQFIQDKEQLLFKYFFKQLYRPEFEFLKNKFFRLFRSCEQRTIMKKTYIWGIYLLHKTFLKLPFWRRKSEHLFT